jgi:hypothetical protein
MFIAGVRDPRIRLQHELPTRDFFALLRATEMEIEGDSNDRTASEQQQAPASQTGRPPPIILTLTTNQMQLQRQLTVFINGNFEFRSTRNGTRVVTKEMADFNCVAKSIWRMRHLNSGK